LKLFGQSLYIRRRKPHYHLDNREKPVPFDARSLTFEFMNHPARSRPAVPIAFLIVFLDLLGFGILIPVQQFYAREFGASPSLITLLSSTFSLVQFLCAPAWGRASDRFGRRPIVLLSVAITAAGYFLFAVAPNVWLLFLARALCGLGAANIATAQAIVADVTPGNDRSRGMGIVGAAFGLGFLFGPIIGGVTSQFGGHAPALVAGGLSVMNFFVALAILPETRAPDRGHAAKQTLRNALRALPNSIVPLFALTAVSMTGFALMEQCIGLLIQDTWVSPVSPDRLHEGSWLTALFLVVVGIVGTIIQGGLIGKLSAAFGEVVLLRVGLAAMGCGLCLIPVLAAGSVYSMFLISALVLAIGSSLYHPSLSALVSKSAGPDHQGLALSTVHSFSALGRIIGPSVAGVLFQTSSSLPFIVGGIAILAVLPMARSRSNG
jgi:MFS transporter, DHA1 family, tetracycline resistance protein